MHGAAQKAIGKRIKEYREKCGLTQEMLAEKTDLTPNYISAVERGISFPRFEKLIAIINAIGASADQIFADVVENTAATRSSGPPRKSRGSRSANSSASSPWWKP